MSRQVNFRKKGEKPLERKNIHISVWGMGKQSKSAAPLSQINSNYELKHAKKKMKAEKEIFVRA